MSVNRIDVRTGGSVAVYKRCAEEQECDINNIGCYQTSIPGVMVSTPRLHPPLAPPST